MHTAASKFPARQAHASANSSATGWRSNEWRRKSAGKQERERREAAMVDESRSVGAVATPQEFSSAARKRTTTQVRSGAAWSKTVRLEVLPSRRFSSARAAKGESPSERKEETAWMKSKRAGTATREEACAETGALAPVAPERVRGSAVWEEVMIFSLVSVKARRSEEGSACRTASRARWTAARWSRAEQ
eukprot:2756231-Pleurochrysis_carterae.AAC.1